MTLHDLESYLRSHQRHEKRKPKQPEPAAVPSHQNAASNGQSLARSAPRALQSSAYRSVGLELGRPQDFEIARPVVPLRQPHSMACWATVFTMLQSWRRQESLSIEDALQRVGQKWVDLFRSNTGTSVADEVTFFAEAGLVAEPLANYTLETWEAKLRTYGPLWVVIDVDPSDKRSIHAVLVTGIHGDGAPAGTKLSIVDPWTGARAATPFTDFVAQYDQGSTRRTSSGRPSQLIHYPKDASFAHAKTANAFTKGPNAPTTTTPGPWSTYFPFRTGSTYEVDGPWTYNGSGRVVERTNDVLRFTLEMPEMSTPSIPAANMLLEIVYKKEGKGNIARATINGVLMEDTDAEITSSGSKRRIVPKYSGFSGPVPEWLSIQPDGSKQVELEVRLDGETRSFDLNLEKGSSGLALGVEPWSRYFHFEPGTKFRVDGPDQFDGTGSVLERTDTFLKFELHMPPGRVLIATIPKLDLLVEATYAKEGPGNKVELTVNGVKYTDANASITSNGNRRTVTPSIKVPDVNLQTIAFSPDGQNEIDLDVTLDGMTHDFDLERLVPTSKTLERRSAAPTSSTVDDGVREVKAFAGRTRATRWKLDRADVAKRLEELVRDPDKVDQGDLNLCGPAAFFHLWVRRDPAGFARYAADLFEKGEARIGTLAVKPSDKLVLNDYAKLRRSMTTLVTRSAEWMCLCALRNSEGQPSLAGDPAETLAAITFPTEVAKWLEATGTYTKVTSDTNLPWRKDLAHARKIQKPSAACDILLLINANMIQKSTESSFILDRLPDHYIQLHSQITSDGKTVQFDYWTWGTPGKQRASISVADFEANYYGSITGEA